MKEDKETIFNAFAQLFVLMAENDTNNIELTFNFKKCKVKFKVDLKELEYKENR